MDSPATNHARVQGSIDIDTNHISNPKHARVDTGNWNDVGPCSFDRCDSITHRRITTRMDDPGGAAVSMYVYGVLTSRNGFVSCVPV